MTRFAFALLVLAAATACGAPVAQPTGDGGVPFDRDAEPDRICVSDDDCDEGEACVDSRFLPVDVCRPGTRDDAGSVVLEDGGAEVDAGSVDAGTVDAGADASTPDECWIDHNLNVTWALVSIATLSGPRCDDAAAPRPATLVTIVRAPCATTAGSTWAPDGTSVNAPCELAGEGCVADLLYPSTLTGDALFRVPAVGDRITMRYGDCEATWRAQNVIEGAGW
jgi:hypothetical protein